MVEAGEFDEPGGLGVGGRGVLGEAGLSGTAGAGEGDEAVAGQVGAEGAQFGLAADEGGEAWAEVALRCAGRRRPQELRVQGGEFGPGVGAEAFGEGAAGVFVRVEGVGGSAGGAQDAELLGAQAFVVRVLPDQGLDLVEQRRRVGSAAAQLGLDAVAEGGGAVRLGGGGVGGAGGLGEVGEGGPRQRPRAVRRVVAAAGSPAASSRAPVRASRVKRWRSMSSRSATARR